MTNSPLRSIKLETRLGLGFAALTIVISAILATIMYLHFRGQVRNGFEERMLVTVGMAAQQISPEAHTLLRDPADESGEVYRDLQKELRRIRTAGRNVRYVYTLRRNAEHKIAFVVDAEESPENVSHLGDVYDEASPELEAAFDTMRAPMVEKQLYTDQWGTWFSGFAPLLDSGGRLEGVLGMDIAADEVIGRENAFLRMTIILFSLTVPLALLLGWMLGHRLAAPILVLRNATERVAAGDLQHPVDAVGCEEIRVLSRSFNVMTTRLRDTLDALHMHRDTLEQQVAARTEELIRANRELTDAKENAIAADRAKSDFLATMSHEIRTPLNGIMGMSSILAETQLTSHQRESIEIVRGCSDVLLTIINDILDFSRHESGKIELEHVEFNLAACLQEIDDLLRHKARAKGLGLTVAIEPNVPACLSGDPGRLRRVLINLINNAIKFTEQGEVAIRVACEETELRRIKLHFRVVDTGIGIEQYDVDRLFLPFIQVDATPTRRFGGTGLGLAICRQLTALLGGAIGVESLPGQGSVFWFTAWFDLSEAIPNLTSMPPVPLPSAAETRTNEHAHILLVEDNPINQKVASLMLKKLGYPCDIANNGQQAVEAFSGHAYDLIFMDCQMPLMDGYSATRAIRERELEANGRVPIVAMTANAMQGDRAQCIEAGMDDYISKPIKIELLLQIIERHLAGRGPISG